jgi:hypothetical protein
VSGLLIFRQDREWAVIRGLLALPFQNRYVKTSKTPSKLTKIDKNNPLAGQKLEVFRKILMCKSLDKKMGDFE